MTRLAPVLQGYFAERLSQRRASPNTVTAYRDTFCLLLRFATRATGRAPSCLKLADLDHVMIAAFLDHLESERGCSISTRNLRLTAIRSLYHYASAGFRTKSCPPGLRHGVAQKRIEHDHLQAGVPSVVHHRPREAACT
jgi:site-specific recombinase XerD